MGEMADMYDEYDPDYELDSGWVNHAEVRENDWITKSGAVVMIKDMTDAHLLNAYKVSGNEDLFAEMVVRLFEQRVGQQQWRVKL